MKTTTALASFLLLATASFANDTIGTAQDVSLNSRFNGSINPAGDVDHLRLTINQPGELTLTSEGTTDTYGFLLNASGSTLASNDDYGSSTNFRIVANVSPGTYYLKIRHYSSTRTGAYVAVNSFRATAPVDDHGNTISRATALSLSNNQASRAGSLQFGGDVDFFAVTVPQAGTLRGFSTGSTDTTGRLYNSAGSQLAYNDDSTDRNFSVQVTVTAGTYYLAVAHYNTTTGTGAYTANFAFTPASTTTPTGQKRALVVGISDYLYINDLSLADDDARSIASLLTSSGWTVTTMLDRSATKAAITNALRTLPNGASQFMFYYSGHGTASGSTGYICPSDTSGGSNLMSESDIRTALSGIASSTKVGMVFDSCNAGAMIGRSNTALQAGVTARYYQIPGAPAPDARAADFFARSLSSTGHVVLAGCRGNQFCYEGAQWGNHGWLTWKLLSAFPSSTRDTNRNRAVSIEEAFGAVSSGLSVGGGARQDPQLFDGNGSAHFDVSRL